MQHETLSPDSGYPRSWRFDDDEDGDEFQGEYVRLDEGPSAYGPPQPIAVFKIAGVERSVWLSNAVLRKRFEEELHKRRPARDFNPGERISIRRGETKKTSAGGHSYWPFWVTFHDSPRKDAASILGDVEGGDGAVELEPEDIPF